MAFKRRAPRTPDEIIISLRKQLDKAQADLKQTTDTMRYSMDHGYTSNSVLEILSLISYPMKFLKAWMAKDWKEVHKWDTQIKNIDRREGYPRYWEWIFKYEFDENA